MDNKNVTDKLSEFLASHFCLYLMTHNYHWNVSGELFQTLHSMFEEQYTEMWKSLDEIAERIRALGAKAPATLDEYQKLSCIGEPVKTTDSSSMIKSIIENTEKLIECAKDVLDFADKAGDQPTVDLMSERIATHQKYIWMLNSIISKGISIKEKMLEYAVNVYGGVENLIEAVLSDEEKLSYAYNMKKNSEKDVDRLSKEARNNLAKGKYEGVPEKFIRQSNPKHRRIIHYGNYFNKLKNKMDNDTLSMYIKK